MSRVLIIGYGNRSRGDDAVGYRAAELLREKLHREDVEILALHQLTPELVDYVRQAKRVIFIDASVEGAPGEIRRRELSASPEPAAFTHQVSPSALLAGAAALYGSTPSGVLYSIAGESFDFGETLSAAVDRAMRELVLRLADAIEQAAVRPE